MAHHSLIEKGPVEDIVNEYNWMITRKVKR